MEETKEVKDSCGEGQILDLSAIGGGGDPKNFLVRNHYYFNEEINPDTARALIINLHEVALTITSACIETGNKPADIELHINSNGGSLSDALQIVQVIKDIQSGKACQIGDALVPIKVNTHIEGEADSGASLIACVGNYRTCSKYAMSLIHPMRAMDVIPKTQEEQEVAFANNKNWNKIYKGVYLEHSKLTEEQLDTMFKTETYYTPEQLVEFGLVDEVV
jgi:ATP-dependent protease ClpP protease subunit